VKGKLHRKPTATSRASFESATWDGIPRRGGGDDAAECRVCSCAFLETGELQKVGADGSGRQVNVRVIAATNRDLRDMLRQGTSARTCSTA
jgi:hypothetical protein